MLMTFHKGPKLSGYVIWYSTRSSATNQLILTGVLAWFDFSTRLEGRHLVQVRHNRKMRYSSLHSRLYNRLTTSFFFQLAFI